MRYEAVLGCNSKQWWLYDSETEEYCDPPISVLNEINKLPSETADDLDKQAELLEDIANSPNDWIDDKDFRYSADSWDI